MQGRRGTKKGGLKGKGHVPAQAGKPCKSGKQRSRMVEPRPMPGKRNPAKKKSLAAAGSGTDRAAERAISAVKLVGILFHERELRNHLQGLYAEAGKIVYEKQMRGPSPIKSPSSHVIELFHRIAALRKKIERLEQDAGALRQASHDKRR